jgi:hypothetical protein
MLQVITTKQFFSEYEVDALPEEQINEFDSI